MDFKTPDMIVHEALLGELKFLLLQCTENQQDFFTKVFHGNIEDLSEDKLKTAIDVCQRTICKNEKGRLDV